MLQLNEVVNKNQEQGQSATTALIYPLSFQPIKPRLNK